MTEVYSGGEQLCLCESKSNCIRCTECSYRGAATDVLPESVTVDQEESRRITICTETYDGK